MNFVLSPEAAADYQTFHAGLVQDGILTAGEPTVVEWITSDGVRIDGQLLAGGEAIDPTYGDITTDTLISHVNSHEGHERYRIRFTRAGWDVHHFTQAEIWQDFLAALPAAIQVGEEVPLTERRFRVAYYGEFPMAHALPEAPGEEVYDLGHGQASELLDLMWEREAAQGTPPRVIEIDLHADGTAEVRASGPLGDHPVTVDQRLAELYAVTVGQRDDFRARFRAARTAAYETIGEVDEYVLAPLLTGAFTGGPTWPGGREVFRVIRTRLDTTVVVTEGLSDPPEAEGDSLGVEVCCELPGRLSLDEISAHLAYAATVQMAPVVLNHGGIGELLSDLEVLSIEFDAPEGTPPDVADQDGTFTTLLGLPSRSFRVEQLWAGVPVRLVTVTILGAADAAAAKLGEAERQEVSERLLRMPCPAMGDFNGTVIEPPSA